jgi:hypothetical protein
LRSISGQINAGLAQLGTIIIGRKIPDEPPVLDRAAITRVIHLLTSILNTLALSYSKGVSNVKEDQLKGLQEAENVAGTDHPRHSELAWSLCYTDSCSIHRSTKEGSRYWPRKKKPIYWEQEP